MMPGMSDYACPEPFDFAFGYAQDRRSGAKSKGFANPTYPAFIPHP